MTLSCWNKQQGMKMEIKPGGDKHITTPPALDSVLVKINPLTIKRDENLHLQTVCGSLNCQQSQPSKLHKKISGKNAARLLLLAVILWTHTWTLMLRPRLKRFQFNGIFTMWELVSSCVCLWSSHLHPRDGWEDLIEATCGLEECSSIYWWWKRREEEGGTVKCFFNKVKRQNKKD